MCTIILAIVAGIIEIASYYFKQKKPETSLEKYEKDKIILDQAIAKHDLAANDLLIDSVLPPPGCTNNSGSSAKSN